MLAQWLQTLFDEGEVVFHGPPEAASGRRSDAVDVVAAAFAIRRLEISGPLLDFDEDVALAAAKYTQMVCWYLVHRDADAAEVARHVARPGLPRTASEHLSADVTLRYVAQLHRRARAIAPEDVLTKSLVDVLRAWPLSGVLSEVDEAPSSGLDFGGHDGLQMLYAERFVGHAPDSWRPQGRTGEYVDLVQR